MALSVLTDDQKIGLQNFQRFKDLVAKAAIRKAKFWQSLDPLVTGGPTGITTLGGYTRWRKSVQHSFNYTQHPANASDAELVGLAITALGNTPAWDSAKPDYDGCCDALLANSNAIIDGMLDAVFDEKIKPIL